MPVIRISGWEEYLTDDIKRKIAQEVTASVAKNLGCEESLVTLIFETVPMKNWATGGVLASDILGSPSKETRNTDIEA